MAKQKTLEQLQAEKERAETQLATAHPINSAGSSALFACPLKVKAALGQLPYGKRPKAVSFVCAD